MFNFNFDLNALADWVSSGAAEKLNQELAALASVATAAAVNSPAVVQAPTNVAPAPAPVQQVVSQVVQAVAPVVAPSVPPTFISKLEPIIVEEVVSNPKVVSSPAGVSVPPAVVNNIASSISTTFKNDAQKDAELRVAVQEVASQPTPTPTPTIDLTNRKTGTLQQSDAIRMAAPSENVAPAPAPTQPVPSRFVNNPYYNAITLEPEDMAGSVTEAKLEAQRRRAISQNIVPSAKEIAKMPPDLQKDVIERFIETQSKKLDEVFSAAEAEQIAIEAEIELTRAEAFESEAKAIEAAAEGEKALAEGDKIIADGVKSGILKYSELPPVFQQAVNQQPEFSDAGLAAAIAALSAVGVEGLADVMSQIRELYPDISSEDALLLLKFDPRFRDPYLARFQGNKMLMDKGLAPLDDKVYLANEQAYSKIFTSYGLNTFNNRSRYADLIGNLVAPEEVGERVSNVYERVTKGPEDVNRALRQLYPELTTQDLMAYALDPKTQLPVLRRKIQAAEIGGAALSQGLTIAPEDRQVMARAPYTNVQRTALGIETLVEEGVTREQAVAGYSAVASVLEPAEKLSAIYGDGYKQYGRLEAEQEAFLKSAEAKAARERLTGREIGEFSGRAGRLASRDRAAGIL